MSVAQSAIIAKWFKGKELAMALGFDLSTARLGAVINGMIIPNIYNSSHTNGLGFALFIGLLICLFSVVCSIFLGNQ